MSDTLETQLRSEMRATTATTPPSDWTDIIDQAQRVHRRDRFVQRLAAMSFVVAIGTALVFAARDGTTSGELIDPAQGPENSLPNSVVSTGHLLASVLVLALLGVGFAIASVRREPSDGWKLWQRYLVVPPIVYPLLAFVFRPARLFAAFELSSNVESVLVIAFKLQTVVCVPLLVYYVAQRISERPTRAVEAAATWSLLGIGVILLARAFIDDIVRISNDPGLVRLWPEGLGHNIFQEEVLPGLDDTPGADWNPTTILQMELIAVVACALLAVLILWLFRKAPVVATLGLLVGVWFSLMIYSTVIAPTGVLIDYDFFLGDIALGATLLELSFFIVPADIVGAFNVMAASLSLAGLLWLWGGPMPRQTAEQSTPPATHVEP